MKTLFSACALSLGFLTAAAQTAEPRFSTTCDEHRRMGSGDESQRYCETRDLTLAAPAGQPLAIEGGANGGITVHGWAGSSVRIRAKVTGWAATAAEAQARVKSVVISTANNRLRATSPDQHERYSVSYEVFVPRQTALTLNTVNGGISLDNLQSEVTFRATNGGVSLASMGGSVKGETTNGGVHIALSGSKWEGKGLDVATTNGGIHWKLPRTYSAQLYTSTYMGGIRTSLPVTKSGMFHKEVTASLGQGGAPLKAVTTNGGIEVSQERD